MRNATFSVVSSAFLRNRASVGAALSYESAPTFDAESTQSSSRFSGNIGSSTVLAASAVKELAKGNPQNQDAISEAGAITPLVAMLASPSPQLQASAAGALANLARNHTENQAAIARTGAVTPLARGQQQQQLDAGASGMRALRGTTRSMSRRKRCRPQELASTGITGNRCAT